MLHEPTQKLLIPTLACLVLVGCGAVGELSDLIDNQELAQQKIEDEHGLNTTWGGNIHNGSYTVATVNFDYSEVKDYEVSALEGMVVEAIQAHFPSEPEQIVVQIISSQAAKDAD